MRWPRFAVLVLIVTLLQSNFIDAIAVTRLNVAPNLLLILMVFFAIRCDVNEAIISSFVIGFAADIIIPGSAMGPRIISYGLLGTGLAYLHRVITIRNMPQEALAIFVAALAAGGLAILVGFAARQSPKPGSVGLVFGTAVYSAIVGPFLFLLLSLLMRIKSVRRRRE